MACYHRAKYHEKDVAQHHLFSGALLHVTNPTKSNTSHNNGEPLYAPRRNNNRGAISMVNLHHDAILRHETGRDK
jgi:hypothetical protein